VAVAVAPTTRPGEQCRARWGGGHMTMEGRGTENDEDWSFFGVVMPQLLIT